MVSIVTRQKVVNLNVIASLRNNFENAAWKLVTVAIIVISVHMLLLMGTSSYFILLSFSKACVWINVEKYGKPGHFFSWLRQD